MNILSSSVSIFANATPFIVGLLGVFAAVWALRAVQKEQKMIREAQASLVGGEAWVGAHCDNEFDLNRWLSGKQIKPDSYVSDVILACWAAWVGGRAASLTELHNLMALREKSRRCAKISSGVAALLLIIGIVGTLSSVMPILKEFQFKVSSDGELQGAAESTELINSLMSRLGDAFSPSLMALVMTVAVVVVRGFYSLKVHEVSLELGRFAGGTILPQYRPRTISEEFKEVKKSLTDLAERITKRERNFSGIVGDLKTLSEGLHPVIKALEKTTAASDEAAERLSSRSRSIADGLTKTLGGSSPIYKAVKGFEGIFERTTAMLDRLSGQIENLGIANENERKDLSQFVGALRADMRAIHDEGAEERKRSVETVGVITSSMNKGLLALHEGLTKFEERHTRSWAESNDELQKVATNALASTLTETMSKVNDLAQAGVAIPATLEKLERVLLANSKLRDEAIGLISAHADRSSAIIDASVAGLETLLRQQRQSTVVPTPVQPRPTESRDIPATDGFPPLRGRQEGGGHPLHNVEVDIGGTAKHSSTASHSPPMEIPPEQALGRAAKQVETTPTLPDKRSDRAGTIPQKSGNWFTRIFKRS